MADRQPAYERNLLRTARNNSIDAIAEPLTSNDVANVGQEFRGQRSQIQCSHTKKTEQCDVLMVSSVSDV